MARRRPQPEPQREENAHVIPADLAAGPCVELWADPAPACPLTSARANWRQARLDWAKRHGLASNGGNLDYRHLPKELRDRAPFHQDSPATSAGTNRKRK